MTAREEARRRLRRDLHDSLGPPWGAFRSSCTWAGDLLERDPAARELLRGLKSQARSAVADIRRLVYELHPPALDDLGLLGAVREAAAQHSANGLRVSVHAPETGILVVTMIEDDDSVFAAMRTGARGYLLKGSDKDEMLLAIRAVACGEAVFGPGIARRLIQYFSSHTPSRTPRSIFPELTDREREILDLNAAGHNNQEIAEKLFLSLKTVRNYVSNIFTKLQVADRAQAIVRARQAGLGQGEG